MVDKMPLMSHRLRLIPKGFGWVDHRLLRDGHIRACSSDSLALYLVLLCASDGQGLSFYGDGLVCSLLGWSRGRLEKAREALQKADLIAWEAPLYQVLEVPEEKRGERDEDDQ
ncbi:MAG: hypothetical protein IKX90_05125 [Verrucomicrobia bacterium]|nr:hypothetical protein [Verrucomicrobiota bacterium]